MLVNKFDQLRSELGALYDLFTDYWEPSPSIQNRIVGLQAFLGDPSKLFKYSNYAAAHYTFLVQGDPYEYVLEDYLMVFFPGDNEVIQKKATVVFDVPELEPRYLLTKRVNTIDLSESYETQTNLDSIDNRCKAEKVSYDSFGYPRIPRAESYPSTHSLDSFHFISRCLPHLENRITEDPHA